MSKETLSRKLWVTIDSKTINPQTEIVHTRFSILNTINPQAFTFWERTSWGDMRPDCFHSHSISQWTDAPRARWIPQSRGVYTQYTSCHISQFDNQIYNRLYTFGKWMPRLSPNQTRTCIFAEEGRIAHHGIIDATDWKLLHDNCQGSLYTINDVTAVTVYDVSGTREALKHHWSAGNVLHATTSQITPLMVNNTSTPKESKQDLWQLTQSLSSQKHCMSCSVNLHITVPSLLHCQ